MDSYNDFTVEFYNIEVILEFKNVNETFGFKIRVEFNLF